MKLTLISLLLLTICCCKNRSSPKHIIPDEYFFPEGILESGKTFVYLNRSNGDTTYLDLFHPITNKKTFLIQCSYAKNLVTDSMILLGQRITDYYINPLDTGELWKANLISDTVIVDNSGRLSEVGEFHWKKDFRYVNATSKIMIEKDTILYWGGKSRPAIITKTIAETNSNFLRAPNGNCNFKMEVINYVCKNVGSIKRVLVCTWYVKPIIIDLIEIREMQKR